MRIALIQQRADTDKQSNVRRGLAAFEQAARGGAELVAFAELAFERFHPQRPARAWARVGAPFLRARHYPEYMRALALGGADLVVVPQAGSVGEWPDGLYEGEMRVAAFQNGYYVALCNRVGEEECLTFAGESFVCAPDGRVIARAPALQEAVLT